MSLVVPLAGTINKVLDHLLTFLDKKTSELATAASQTSMQATLNSVDTNVSALSLNVPNVAASQTSVDTVDGIVDEIVVDTRAMEPAVAAIKTETSEIVVDTREIVGDVNAVLLDTAALDARLNATWAGRLDANVSTRLSSAVRRVVSGAVTGVAVTSASGIDNRYVNVTIPTALTNWAKAFVIVSGSFGASATSAGSYDAGNSIIHGRMTSNTNLRVSSARNVGTNATFVYTVIELY